MLTKTPEKPGFLLSPTIDFAFLKVGKCALVGGAFVSHKMDENRDARDVLVDRRFRPITVLRHHLVAARKRPRKSL